MVRGIGCGMDDLQLIADGGLSSSSRANQLVVVHAMFVNRSVDL